MAVAPNRIGSISSLGAFVEVKTTAMALRAIRLHFKLNQRDFAIKVKDCFQRKNGNPSKVSLKGNNAAVMMSFRENNRIKTSIEDIDRVCQLLFDIEGKTMFPQLEIAEIQTFKHKREEKVITFNMEGLTETQTAMVMKSISAANLLIDQLKTRNNEIKSTTKQKINELLESLAEVDPEAARMAANALET